MNGSLVNACVPAAPDSYCSCPSASAVTLLLLLLLALVAAEGDGELERVEEGEGESGEHDKGVMHDDDGGDREGVIGKVETKRPTH